jgi:hypothetical protein
MDHAHTHLIEFSDEIKSTETVSLILTIRIRMKRYIAVKVKCTIKQQQDKWLL